MRLHSNLPTDVSNRSVVAIDPRVTVPDPPLHGRAPPVGRRRVLSAAWPAPAWLRRGGMASASPQTWKDAKGRWTLAVRNEHGHLGHRSRRSCLARGMQQRVNRCGADAVDELRQPWPLRGSRLDSPGNAEEPPVNVAREQLQQPGRRGAGLLQSSRRRHLDPGGGSPAKCGKRASRRRTLLSGIDETDETGVSQNSNSCKQRGPS